MESSALLLTEDFCKSSAKLENIPTLFNNTNKTLIRIIDKLNSLDPNNPRIEELLAYSKESSNNLFSLENYNKHYDFFSSELFLNELENTFQKIKLQHLLDQIEEALKNVYTTENMEELPNNYKNIEALFQANALNIEYLKAEKYEKENNIRELDREIKSLKQNVKQTSEQIAKSNSEIGKKFQELHDEKFEELDKAMKKLFSNDALKAKEEHFLDSYNFFRKRFEEIYQYYKKTFHVKKIEMFDIENFKGYMIRERQRAENAANKVYCEVKEAIRTIESEKKKKEEKKRMDCFKKKIELLKDFEKEIKALEKKQSQLSKELINKKTEYNIKKNSIEGQNYGDKFKENVLTLGNLVVFLIMILLFVAVILL